MGFFLNPLKGTQIRPRVYTSVHSGNVEGEHLSIYVASSIFGWGEGVELEIKFWSIFKLGIKVFAFPDRTEMISVCGIKSIGNLNNAVIKVVVEKIVGELS